MSYEFMLFEEPAREKHREYIRDAERMRFSAKHRAKEGRLVHLLSFIAHIGALRRQ